jgi:hypothetical protein
MPTDRLHINIMDTPSWERREEGLLVTFVYYRSKMDARFAIRNTAKLAEKHQLGWVIPSREAWHIDASLLRDWLVNAQQQPESAKDLEWLSGLVRVVPAVQYQAPRHDPTAINTNVSLTVYKEDYLLDKKSRIFLSHKGSDKEMVRRFSETLKELGFDPWLDEKAMPAGTELHRGILQGFQDSCAAVFFITPQFKDERYLRTEINHAAEQKNEKGKRFSIITLIFSGESGEKGVVPDLLRSYVWKEPANELEALNFIVEALPIKPGLPSWRKGL